MNEIVNEKEGRRKKKEIGKYGKKEIFLNDRYGRHLFKNIYNEKKIKDAQINMNEMQEQKL